jgi:hypothetical protein
MADHGADLCDSVASVLNGRTSFQVNGLNRDLNFFFVGQRTKGEDLGGMTQEEIANLRRAAKLLTKSLPLPAGLNAADSDGWSNATLRGVLRTYGTAHANYRPGGTGFYLKGSFWGFADHDERVWMRNSWGEASYMLDYGRTVVRQARGNETSAANLVRRWFGTSDMVTIENNLNRIMNGMLTEYVGICYLGPGLAAADGYKEYGPNVVLGDLKDGMGGTEVGFAAPVDRRIIGFHGSFFEATTAAVRRSVLHDTTARRVLECTRGGGIVHELSHVFLKTKDHKIPNSVYSLLGLPAPASEGTRASGYGPRACAALAQTSPDLALTNADCYRLFCEDAQILLGR